MSRREGLFKIGTAVKDLDPYLNGFQQHWGIEKGNKWARSTNTKSSARNYMVGVMLPGKQKNMSKIAKRVAVDSNNIQQFISDSPWDPDAVMETNIEVMNRLTGDPRGIFIVDDTGQLKQGKTSPGVVRQYSGTIGKVGNCQVAVNCVYAVPAQKRNADIIYWPTGMSLYLPEEWTSDHKRRRKAGIPEELEFKTKPQIGLELLEKARMGGLPHQATVADAGYGTDFAFRKQLRDWKEPYVVGVRPDHISVVPEETEIILPEKKPGPGRPPKYPQLPNTVHAKTANEWFRGIKDEDWKTIAWTEGTKGTLQADFVRYRVRVVHDTHPTDETGWLLFERTSEEDWKVYMCWGLDDCSLEDLVKFAHSRWVIEQTYKQMKQELGLDQFEGRKWLGWHHNAAMVMLAFSYLMLLRIIHDPGEGPFPSLPQIRRELLRYYTRRFLELRLNLSVDEADAVLDDLPFLIPE